MQVTDANGGFTVRGVVPGERPFALSAAAERHGPGGAAGRRIVAILILAVMMAITVMQPNDSPIYDVSIDRFAVGVENG